MDRVQRSGLIALTILVLTAVGAHLVGLRPGSEAKIPPRVAVQEPSSLESIEFLPPEQRKLFVDHRSFLRPPVPSPLQMPTAGSRPLAKESAERGQLVDLDRPKTRPNQNPPSLDPVIQSSPATERPPRTTRVREGETLGHLSQRVFGTSKRWREIADLNGLKPPYILRIGQLLRLPEDSVVPAVATEPGRATPAVQTAPSSRLRTYIVRSGDTPGEIAKRFYGSSIHYQRILDHNHIRDAHKMWAGMVLEIPPLPGE